MKRMHLLVVRYRYLLLIAKDVLNSAKVDLVQTQV